MGHDRVRVERQLPGGRILLAGFSGQGPNLAAYVHLTAPVSLPCELDHRFWVAGLYGARPSLKPNPTYVGGYQIRLSRSFFSLQPTWMWILRPGGGGEVPAIGAAGLQITWGF